MRRLVVLLVGSLLFGCQAPPPPPLPQPPEAAGEVKDAAGDPLTGVLLRFYRMDVPGGEVQTISVPTRAEGKFSFRGEPGRFRVTVRAAPGPNAPPPQKDAKPKPPPLPPGVPERYGSPETTPWEVTVPPGGKKDIVLQVEK